MRGRSEGAGHGGAASAVNATIGTLERIHQIGTVAVSELAVRQSGMWRIVSEAAATVGGRSARQQRLCLLHDPWQRASGSPTLSETSFKRIGGAEAWQSARQILIASAQGAE
jgi:hypothetical protein